MLYPKVSTNYIYRILQDNISLIMKPLDKLIYNVYFSKGSKFISNQ